LRFLIALAGMTGEKWRFVGRGRLMERPLGVYADVFAQSGALFEQDDDGLLVQGPLLAGEYRLPGDVSSQFISGLLLALPLADGDSVLVLTSPLESAAYVDLTISVMAVFGVAIERDARGNFLIAGGQRYRAADYTVEGDYSQAAFFLGAGALGRTVACAGLLDDSLQGDFAIIDILGEMGADVAWDNGLVSATTRRGRLQAVTIDAREIPDLVPPLAALCCFASGTSKIINAGRLRIKESDRLAAMAQELRKLGADITETADGLIIVGRPSLRGGAVDAHNDHRIAMAMALAAIGCNSPVTLTGWQSVQKSYPQFWAYFEKEAVDG
jgi:3-phosphoshikimate 1-carboxyvinyltransferase